MEIPPKELPNESFENVSEGTVDFVEDDAEKKERMGYVADYEQTPGELQGNEMYRAIFENISDGIIYVDKHGKILNANKGSFDIFGYKPEEMIGKNFSRLGWFGVKDLPKMFRLFKGAIKDRAIDLMELEVKHKAGHIVSVEASTWPVKKNGNTAGFLSIVRDVTERKHIENVLQDDKKRFEKLSNLTFEGILIHDKGIAIDVNKSFMRILGYKREELIGRDIIELCVPQEYHAMIKENIANGRVEPYEAMVKRKDGTLLPVELEARNIKNEDGEIRAISVRDITKWKEAEKSLKENEEKFRTFMETARDLMSITDKDGNFTDINKAMTRILGYSREEMIGMHITQILTKESLENDFKPNWEKLITNGEIGIETMFATKSGSNIYGELKAVAIYDGDNKYVGGRVVIHDITGRRKAEKEIMESQKKIKEQNVKLKKLDELKSAFLNVTSHELRTPMSSIKGYVQLLIRQSLGNISKEQEKALKVVLRNTDRLDHLIQDILDISRLVSGTMKFIPEKTDLQKMMNEVAETMKSSAEFKEITVDVDIEGVLPELEIDQDRIKQVVINFINNAIKFSPDGAIVNLRAKKEGNNVLFEVQDFGRGIPKDKHEKVFETFYQVDSGRDRKFGGVGLGLAISRGIVIAHGGRIWVESKGKSGQGSSFKFALPIKSVKDVEDRFKKVDIFKLQWKERNVEKNDSESGMEE